ncbi:MAG TPA: Ig-like domain-containing protein [Acidimicrobiales bacterium]|nr:Ig-like domain-containing protein [Acidimicrobiales bacterium]
MITVLGALTTGSLALGAQPAGALICQIGFNCSPTNVNIPQPGSQSLSGLNVCGIIGSYAPIASRAIDQNYDDPNGFGGSTNEGNYTDSETFQFRPATTLGPNSTITIKLPHPAEPYSSAGSILPPASFPLSSFETPEQLNSTVTTFYSASTSDFFIQLHLSGATGTVRLDGFDPYNPVSVNNGPGPHVSGNGGASINGYDVGNGHYDLGNQIPTDGSGNAYFEVQRGGNQDVVFAATDVTSGLGLAQTDTVSFGTGGGSGPCSNAPFAPGAAIPYLIIKNGVGYFASATVSTASGVESVTLTVPLGGPTWGTGDTVTVDALDAVSPPGYGTSSHGAANPLYHPTDFTISTNDDPVPGSPANAPVFVGNYDTSKLGNCFGESSPQIDPCHSTLIPSTNNDGQAVTTVSDSSGNTVTATLRDIYNNPVNQQNLEVTTVGTTNAIVTPQAPPATQDNQHPAASITGDDGTATFDVTDTCAETTHVTGFDVTQNVNDPFPNFGDQIPIQFVPGQAVAPDSAAYTPSVCLGRTTAQSSIGVSQTTGPPFGSSANEAGDGQSQATVKVTLADQFGNAVNNTCVSLNQQNAADGTATHATTGPTVASTPPTAANCPTGSAYTDSSGVAFFSVSDASAENVVFSVFGPSTPPWPINSATNPSDLVTVNFMGVDPGHSTVTASQTNNVPGNGYPAATVTVTLHDASNDPVANKNVTLASNPSDPSTTITPVAIPTGSSGCALQAAAGTTDCHGQANFSVADNCVNLPTPCTRTVGHVVTYQATDISDTVQNAKVVIPQTVTISFTSGGATVFASPTTLVADGPASFSTVQVNLVDTSGASVSGATVTLAPSQGSPPVTAVISPGTTTTDPTGTATFTVSDTHAEVVSLTATASYTTTNVLCASIYSGPVPGSGTCSIALPVTLTFLSAPSSLNLTASPASVPADGVTTSQVTVTALDANNHPIQGLPLELLAPPSETSVFVDPQSATTDNNGQAVFSVSDGTLPTPVPDPVTFTAEYGQGQGASPSNWHALTAPAGQVVVTFTPTANELEAADSTISPVACSPATNPVGSAPADGHSPVCVTVTLKSSATKGIGQHAVALTTGSPWTSVLPSPTSNFGGLTAASGAVSFTVTDSQPETLTVYARDLNTGVIITGTITISFSQTEAQASTVVANPTSLPAGGPVSTITVTLQKGAGTPITGHTVSLTSSSPSVTISPGTPSGDTTTFTVSDKAIESVTIGAVDKTAGVTLLATATVVFTGSEANQSSVTINPASTPAYGPAATLTVTLRDANGVPISGQVVTISGATATTTVTAESTATCAVPAPFGTTDCNGQAMFAVSDTAVESETLTACDTTSGNPGGPASDPLCAATVGTTRLDQTATISFTTSESLQSSMTDPVTTLAAGGLPGAKPVPAGGVACATAACNPTTTVTVKLLSGGRLPLAGHIVTLSSSSPTVSILPLIGTTNASGVATFTVGDSAVESGVVLSALDRTTGYRVRQTVTLNFTADEANQSTVTAVPTNASGSQWMVTVTLKGLTLPLSPTHQVSLTLKPLTGFSHAYVRILTPGGRTTSAGVIQFSVTDPVTQIMSVTVKDTTTGVWLVQLYHPLVVTVF